MKPFVPLAEANDLPPWLALRCALEGEQSPLWVAPAAELAQSERKALDLLAESLCDQLDASYLGLALYGALEYAPLKRLDWLGLKASQLQQPPEAAPIEAVRGAWRHLLEAWGDAQGAPPNKTRLSDAEAVRLLPLGRAKGFPAGKARQLAEFLRRWAKSAPEGAWFALEPLPEGQTQAWVAEVGPEGLSAHQWQPFDQEPQAANDLPQGLSEAAEELAEAVERQLLRAVRLEFFWTPHLLRPLGLVPEPGSPVRRLKLLLKRYQAQQMSAEELAQALVPSEVESLLVGRLEQTEALEPLDGGSVMTGQAGAASGRLYCSAQTLLEAPEGPKILALPELFPEDLPALQAASGLITTEGGYASHGPVLARSLGVPALLLPEAKVERGSLRLGGRVFETGAALSWQAPMDGPAQLFAGLATVAPPASLLLGQLGEALNTLPKPMDLLVNVEDPEELGRALEWGARGVGLLRLENLLGEEPQLTRLRALLLGASPPRLLSDLAEGLKRSLLRVLDRQATGLLRVRLMDFPWHELLPQPGEATIEAAAQLARLVPGRPEEEWIGALEEHREVNPMLGLRGARLALAHFEVYRPQVLALLEAVELIHRKRHRLPKIQVMVPFVGRASELEALIQGRREVEGLAPLVEHWLEERGFSLPPFEVDWGVMIELPSAALDAAELARHARFFSFGGNDLSQTALGHSRDDWGRLGPALHRLDLSEDPFIHLDPLVVELIALACERGRSLRPDLDLSFCGEQRLSERDLSRLAARGLNSISVPPLQVPGSLLRLVRLGLASR